MEPLSPEQLNIQAIIDTLRFQRDEAHAHHANAESKAAQEKHRADLAQARVATLEARNKELSDVLKATAGDATNLDTPG